LLVALIGVLIFFHKQKVKRLDMEREIMQAQYKQTLLQAQLEIQEETFNNISREIHDNVGQLLSLAKVQVNIIDQSGKADKSSLSELKQNIGQALIDLRDIAKSLSGERMIALGLQQTVQQEIDRINRSQCLKASFIINGEPHNFSDQKQIIMVRIVQEALQNIIKHAEADKVEILLTYLSDVAELEVKDNGKGFNAEEKIKNRSGLGLQNIINRAGVIGGKAAISSRVNRGTNIKLLIPYE
jgi:signal transduction histidine kinase